MSSDAYREERTLRKYKIKNLKKFDKLQEAIYDKANQEKMVGSTAIMLNDKSNVLNELIAQSQNLIQEKDTTEDGYTNRQLIKNFFKRFTSSKNVDDLVAEMDDNDIWFVLKHQPAVMKELNKYSNLTNKDVIRIIQEFASSMNGLKVEAPNLTTTPNRVASPGPPPLIPLQPVRPVATPFPRPRNVRGPFSVPPEEENLNQSFRAGGEEQGDFIFYNAMTGRQLPSLTPLSRGEIQQPQRVRTPLLSERARALSFDDPIFSAENPMPSSRKSSFSGFFEPLQQQEEEENEGKRVDGDDEQEVENVRYNERIGRVLEQTPVRSVGSLARVFRDNPPDTRGSLIFNLNKEDVPLLGKFYGLPKDLFYPVRKDGGGFVKAPFSKAQMINNIQNYLKSFASAASSADATSSASTVVEPYAATGTRPPAAYSAFESAFNAFTGTKPPSKGNGLGQMTERIKSSSNEVSNKSKYPLIIGRGLSTNTDEKYKPYRKYYDKIYIDLNKLKKNILFCKYIQTSANITGLRTQTISDDLRDLISDTINEKYNKKVFSQLSTTDKIIFKKFIKAFKFSHIEVPEDDDVQEFQKKLRVLVGSWYAGNDSPELRKELIKYVRQAIALGMISQQDAFSLLYELSS
jgi:hypothetical protein